MAIVVVGGGAIGLLVAGRLAQSAQHVALLARPSTVQALAATGLHITQQSQSQTVDTLVAAPDPAHLPPAYRQPALAILCVKGYDTPDALPTLAALDPQLILTLQNGIGNEETLAGHFGPDNILSGAITSSVEPTNPAHIVVTKAGGIALAPVSGTPDIAGWATLFTQAGFPVRTTDSYRALKWSKALLNMLGNATAAILDMSVEDIYSNPRMVAMEKAAFLEGIAVMQRLGVAPINLPGYPAALLANAMQRLPFPIMWRILRRAIAGGRGGKAPSLQRDLHYGKQRTEGDTLYGAIARTASDSGITAPVNATLWYVLHGIVNGSLPREYFRHKPERLLDVVHISS